MRKAIYGCPILFFCSMVNAELLITSPTQVCEALASQGLNSRGWNDNYGYECSSNYKEIGTGSPLANNIAYYAEGDADHVTQAKLVLNINNKSQKKTAISELINSSETLSKLLTGKNMPKKLEKSIKEGKRTSVIIEKTTIEVTRNDWPSGSGYEIHVLFK